MLHVNLSIYTVSTLQYNIQIRIRNTFSFYFAILLAVICCCARCLVCMYVRMHVYKLSLVNSCASLSLVCCSIRNWERVGSCFYTCVYVCLFAVDILMSGVSAKEKERNASLTDSCFGFKLAATAGN